MIKKVERKDKLKNKAKVIKEVLKNPLDTTREIEKKTGISRTTVAKTIKEIGQNLTKDDRILGVCDDDFEIIKLTQGETIKRIKEKPDEVSMQDLIRAGAESTKRYTIFKGDITDKDGGTKMPDVSFNIIDPTKGED